ncbi:MAG: hypothetical protein EZS28_015602 [Streblomastix strix]|uniref:Kinetochore protein SPC25 n=1 Tax=Streblomastix strix TaxID=222440 RepID=A0A5J4W1U1_9EUKA|nr:MAG: hypothetical protein EZS28_015602 [Streblomastix strix]
MFTQTLKDNETVKNDLRAALKREFDTAAANLKNATDFLFVQADQTILRKQELAREEQRQLENQQKRAILLAQQQQKTDEISIGRTRLQTNHTELEQRQKQLDQFNQRLFNLKETYNQNVQLKETRDNTQMAILQTYKNLLGLEFQKIQVSSGPDIGRKLLRIIFTKIHPSDSSRQYYVSIESRKDGIEVVEKMPLISIADKSVLSPAGTYGVNFSRFLFTVRQTFCQYAQSNP